MAEQEAGRPAEGPAPSARGTRATIHDVAREAGVSSSAVSKVLTGAPGVSPQMRERVTTAMQRLQYRPRAGARAMRGRSYTVGVMLITLSSPFQPQVVDGIIEQLAPTAYQEMLVVGGPTVEHQQSCINALTDRQVDGLILIAPGLSSTRLEELGAAIPTVVIARHGHAVNYDTVNDDDARGAALVIDHLVGLGHRRISHISHPIGGLRRPSVLSHTVRADGYVAAMEAHGLEPDVVAGIYTEEGGYRSAVEVLDRPERPTAVFAGADIAAIGVLRAARERGLDVPGDISVAGYDNTFLSSIGGVSLTTVDQSGHLLGTTSAKLLLERLEDGRERAVSYVVDPALVVRQTSGRLRATE